jgi:hypothetical protein
MLRGNLPLSRPTCNRGSERGTSSELPRPNHRKFFANFKLTHYRKFWEGARVVVPPDGAIAIAKGLIEQAEIENKPALSSDSQESGA